MSCALDILNTETVCVRGHTARSENVLLHYAAHEDKDPNGGTSRTAMRQQYMTLRQLKRTGKNMMVHVHMKPELESFHPKF